MTLKEISQGYRDAAALIRGRLAVLRSAVRNGDDPDKIWQMRREIAVLTPVLTQLNELAKLTEHYYERGYYRDPRFTL